MARKSLIQVEDISRELDLVVFKLESPAKSDADALIAERRKLRRELESLRDRLSDVVRELE